MDSPFSLTSRTIKRCPLGLDDPPDHCFPASRAHLSLAIINAMVALIATGLVEGIAIRPIGKRGAFVSDRLGQHVSGCCMQALPLRG